MPSTTIAHKCNLTFFNNVNFVSETSDVFSEREREERSAGKCLNGQWHVEQPVIGGIDIKHEKLP